MDLLKTPIIYENSGTKYRFLTGWLKARVKNGIYLHPSLSLLYNPEWKYGIGAATTISLEKGTVVARIPKDIILSPRTVTNQLLREVLAARELTGILGLTIAYIFEICKMEESHFGGYLATLTFPKVPRTWRNEEKEILKGTEVDYSDALSLRDIKIVYKGYIKPFVQEFQEMFGVGIKTINEDFFAEAFVVVASRCFQIDNYHGLALVPIADLFNHTYLGNEDVSFQCVKEVCPKCGAWPENCRCKTKSRPTKRQKLDHEEDGQDSEMETTSVLGSNGEGWTTQETKPPPLSPPIDTCDMVLTKDITQVRQLFNNYGPLSNLELLSEYGFIDENSQNDYVSLRSELFDIPNFDKGKREYWKTNGFKLVMGIARATQSSHLDEMEILLRTGKCPMTDDPFVRWSLAIGKHDWVRFPLKIWIMLRLLSPVQWHEFDNASEQRQINYFVSRFVGGMTRLDILEMPLSSLTYLEVERWNNLLADALDTRLMRYNDNLTSEECFKLRKEALSSSDDSRKAMAYWCKGNEKLMLENCQQRVKYCAEQICLFKTRLQETERWKPVACQNPFAEMTWGEPTSK